MVEAFILGIKQAKEDEEGGGVWINWNSFDPQ